MSAPDIASPIAPVANGLRSAACYGHEDQNASTRAGNPAGVRPIAQRLTHLDLFSGIGGFALAARWAGIDTIGFSEIEPYACRVLAKNFPNIPNHGDITKLNGVRADIVTGGFPCQPFSLAGKQRGKEDDRHLWPEMLRVIADAKPTWVVGENVPGIIGMELDGVLSDLEGIGYSAWPLAIPACGVDAKHRRNRVWIVAHATSINAGTGRRGRSETRPQTANGGAHVANADKLNGRAGAGRQNGAEALDVGEDVADAESEQARRIQQRAFSAYSSDGSDGRSETSTWLPEPELGRVADGIPNRSHRLRGLGNAIVPQVAFVILDAIAAIEFAEQVAGVGALADLGGASPLRNAKARNVAGQATTAKKPQDSKS